MASSDDGSTDFFRWPELATAVLQRRDAEVELRKLARDVQSQFSTIQAKSKDEQEFQSAVRKLQQEALRRHQKIAFGVDDPHARAKYLRKFGCCGWTDGAIDMIRRIGKPIIEIGAGQGHWQKKLSEAGIDALAFDNFEGDFSIEREPVGDVKLGDENVLLAYPDRVLFLCCPPPTDFAERAIDIFEGHHLIYVGEGYGGAHANDAFFDKVKADFDLVETAELDNFPMCHERLFHLRRASE